MSMVCSATCNHVDVMDHVAPEGHIHVHGLCFAAVTIYVHGPGYDWTWHWCV